MSQAESTIGADWLCETPRARGCFPQQISQAHGLSLHCEMREEFVKSRISADEIMPKRK